MLGWWGREKLKMVWKVEKNGQISYLIGTAHFSPYRFKKALIRLFERVETVFFEGPLDDDALSRVAQYGRQGQGSPSVYEALRPEVIQTINRYFDERLPHRSAEWYMAYFGTPSSNFMETSVRGVRPWMALFILWSAFLNWKHSVDREAFRLAQRLGKRIRFLETIDEQLLALDGIPFERIVDYIHRFSQWESYKIQFIRDYLRGDLEGLMSRTKGFPTRCESILGERDRRFFESLLPYFEKGGSAAFLGLSHIPSLIRMFSHAGYQVTQVTL